VYLIIFYCLFIANRVFQLEKLISRNYLLCQSAVNGYRSYLQAYASHFNKSIFSINSLDLLKVGKSFGFSTPRINITAAMNHKKRRREKDGSDGDESYEGQAVRGSWGNKKQRIAQLGVKKVRKEVYRQKSFDKRWSR
jgi:Domain of unknown function (DUF4217)